MPEVLTIPQLKAMENEFPIPITKLKIKSVGKPRASKPDSAKSWKFQELVGTDGNNEINITLCDLDDFPREAIGKWYLFEATHGPKGWTGCKIKDKEYQGKVTRNVWVTSTGVITCASDGAASHQKPAQPDGRGIANTSAPTPPRPDSAPTNGPAGSHAQMVKNIKDAKAFAMREANWMLISIAATKYIATKLDEPLPPAWLQAICSSIFISGGKAGIADTMPAGPLEKYTEQAAAPPPPPPPPVEPEPEEDTECPL